MTGTRTCLSSTAFSHSSCSLRSFSWISFNWSCSFCNQTQGDKIQHSNSKSQPESDSESNRDSIENSTRRFRVSDCAPVGHEPARWISWTWTPTAAHCRASPRCHSPGQSSSPGTRGTRNTHIYRPFETRSNPAWSFDCKSVNT